jgi:hypothetical protein
MATDKTDKKIGEGDSIPELDPSRPSFGERIRRQERNIANMFTVKREFDLANGGGAPGTTGLGNYEPKAPQKETKKEE